MPEGGGGRALSRRSLLAGAALALGAAAQSGCGSGSGSSATPAPAGGERTDDVEILNGALDVERQAIAAYASAAHMLRGADAALARRVLAHERDHAASIASLIREFGAAPNPPSGSAPPRRLRSRSAALGFLGGVENTAIAYYLDALPKLSGPFRHELLGIVASEAEHLSALRMALGLSGAPGPFVWGRP